MGAFSVLGRSGEEKNSFLELTLVSLNDSRGDAILSEPGTVAWVENMAMARVIFQALSAVQRLANQFDPTKMNAYLERWEAILRITPSPDDTHNDRRRNVGTKIGLIGQSALVQTVQDILAATIPSLFVELIRTPSSKAHASWPQFEPVSNGGLIGRQNLGSLPPTVIEGGNTIGAGPWYSSVSDLRIRVTQPLVMDDVDFYRSVNDFKPFLYDFIPAYTTFGWGRFGLQVGTISLSPGGTTVTGVGTLFTTSPGRNIAPNDGIEVWDDAGILHTLVVDTITDDTHLEVLTYNGTSITAQPWKRKGFFLDQTNLDNAFLV